MRKPMTIWFLILKRKHHNNLIISILRLDNSLKGKLFTYWEWIEYWLYINSYDSIICLAGGFDMGNAKDKDVFEKYEKLDRMNLQSALLTSHLATRYLGE